MGDGKAEIGASSNPENHVQYATYEPPQEESICPFVDVAGPQGPGFVLDGVSELHGECLGQFHFELFEVPKGRGEFFSQAARLKKGQPCVC